MLTSDTHNQAKTVSFPLKRRKRESIVKRMLSLYCILMCVAWITIWFSQESIKAYWQQTYHRASPFEALETLPFWRAGGELQNAINEQYAKLQNRFVEHNENWVAQWAVPPTPLDSVDVAKPQKPAVEKLYPNKKLANNETVAPASTPKAETVVPHHTVAIHLTAGDKVLFAGDSMIQGVAPHLQKKLKSQYQIDSINLSKQSTGLAYPKFFDWPATIEQTFASDPKVKLLVILVGANDPWDFPNPEKPQAAYLKFESSEWETEYMKRVHRIVAAAKHANAKIIWLGIPHMKREKLNTQMIYLNKVLERGLNGKHPNVLWLETANLLSDNHKVYQDTIQIDGQAVRVRSKDGIHFTGQGQQFVADYIAKHITFPNASQTTK